MDSVTHEHDLKIDFWGCFQAPEVEAAFRQSQRRQELWQAALAIAVGFLWAIAYIPNDLRLLGSGPLFWTFLWVRVAYTLGSFAALYVIWKGVAPSVADRILFTWVMTGAVITIGAGYTRPSFFFLGYLFAAIFSLLILFFVVPLPLLDQFAVAAVALAANAAMLYLQHRDLDLALFRAATFGYTMTNILGLTVSWNLHRLKRDQFAALLRLESALAEVKTLQGIVPICSHCKSVRNDAGYWQAVEDYVRENSQASFTHGICPDCIRAHFPGVLEGRAKPR